MVRYISGKLSLFYDAMNKKHTFSINLEFSSKQNHLRYFLNDSAKIIVVTIVTTIILILNYNNFKLAVSKDMFWVRVKKGFQIK